MTVMWILIGLLMLSLLVFVHEFGHFIVARLVGVHVVTFSIGFGKKLMHWQGKETEYCISSLPFGGYVKLAGQDPDDELVYGDNDFRMKKIWQRAAIVLAGPFANYVFAVLVLWVLFMAGVHESPNEYDLTVGTVMSNSAGAKAGIRPGDKLLQLEGKPIRTWEAFASVVHLSVGKPLQLVYLRDKVKHKTSLIPQKIHVEGIGAFGESGISSVFKPVIGHVLDSSVAYYAGMLVGDTIVAINHQPVNTWNEMLTRVQNMDTLGQFSIKRKDSVFTIAVTPEFNEAHHRYMIGIARAPAERIFQQYDFFQAGQKALVETKEIVLSMRLMLRALIQRRISPRSMAGPIGIIQMTGNAARMGLEALISFLALISVNFAVINLLPLVITDGGVLLLLLLEKIRGKPLSRHWQTQIQYVFIFFFIALFLFLTLNDILRIPKLIWR